MSDAEYADDRRVREGIAGFLSSQLDAPVDVVGLGRPTATGFSADTMLVDVHGLPGVGRLVVQAAPVGPSLFADYDLGRTFGVQRALAPHGVPVPPVRWLCEDPQWLGTRFYVMDFVSGRVPPDRPPYHVAGWLAMAPFSERELVWTSGIEAMAALHSVPTSGFGFLDEPGPADAASQRLWRWGRFGEEQGADAEPLLAAALDRLSASRPASADRVVHWGDAKLGNMIFGDEGVAAILDWELCGLSVGEEDLAHWLAVDWLLSTGIGNPRLSGLPSAEASVALYERAAGRRTESVEWWFAFALVRMGLIFQRAAIQSRQRRGGGELRTNAIVPHLPGILDGTVWDGYRSGSRPGTAGGSSPG